ncbi:hypothetical protein DFS33DRAFT_1269142 [Desarmillaria ectypa]|nr:hypothetical protein DFS33DRAFT_1269142 [Desarmillaria ectypa]
MDSDIKLYLKPRSVYSQLGNRPWMLIRPRFFYGPFFSAWQPIPPDATEVHTVHSPALAPALTKLEAEFIPVLRGLNQIFHESGLRHLPKLVFGDKAPRPASRYRKDAKHYPEFWKNMYEAAFPLNRDVELVNLDIDLQRLLWIGIHMFSAKNIMSLADLKIERSCKKYGRNKYVGAPYRIRQTVHAQSLAIERGRYQTQAASSTHFRLHQYRVNTQYKYDDLGV